MKPSNRQQHILARLRAVPQEWRVEDLAAAMNVSPLTIRRDLDVLAASGTIVRTLGGCLALTRVQNTVYQSRVEAQFDLKQAIGREAAREVQSGNSILINDGSTTFHMASHLGECGRVSVYTNSVAMISELSRFPNLHIYLLGGEYQTSLFYLGGSLMERVLEMIEVDLAFMGADAIDATGRCLAVDQDTARIAQLMLRRARRRILLADHTKLTMTSQVVFGSVKDFHVWITSSGADPDTLSSLRSLTTIKEIQA